VLGMHVQAGDSVASQLRELGIDKSRVKTIVATHLHLDHVGGAIDFPDAEIVCADVELSAFRSMGSVYGYRAQDIMRGARLRPVNVERAPSYGFPASYDLFGDGEIVLLDACGHTPGLVAVAMRGRGESACYVHVGDAVYQSWEYALAPRGPSLIARISAWRRSLLAKTYESVRACEADPRRPLIVPSHDFAVFARLPHAPAMRDAA
jgi:N-acyl homoserine lactone hydrolase